MTVALVGEVIGFGYSNLLKLDGFSFTLGGGESSQQQLQSKRFLADFGIQSSSIILQKRGPQSMTNPAAK